MKMTAFFKELKPFSAIKLLCFRHTPTRDSLNARSFKLSDNVTTKCKAVRCALPVWSLFVLGIMIFPPLCWEFCLQVNLKHKVIYNCSR